MKNLLKKISVPILIVLMVCLFPKSMVYASGAGVEVEPNNTLDTANSIEVNTKYIGRVDSARDVDYYKFTLASDGNTTINFDHKQMVGDETAYWQVTFLDGNNNQYVFLNVQGKKENTSQSIGLPKGTYYIKINAYYRSFPYDDYTYNNMDYNINIGFESSNLYEREYNNSLDKANPIEVNTKYIGRVDSEKGVDYYKFTLASDGNTTINFDHKQMVGDETAYWQVTLLDGDNNQYVFLNVQGKKENTSQSIGLPKGTYYIKINAYYRPFPYDDYTYNNMDYNINIGFESSNLYEKEYNNSLDKANPIQVNTKYIGRTDSERGVDYYKFTLASDENTTINFDHKQIVGDETAYWQVTLLDGDNKQYAFFDVQGKKENTSQSIRLPKGTYYIKINAYYRPFPYNDYTYNNMDYQIYVVPLAVTASPNAASVGYNSIKTSWSSVTGASGYEIYRSTSNTGTYSLVSTTTSTSFINIGLNTGTTYYYKVRAYITVGNTKAYSGYSAVVSAKPIPATPTSVKAVSSSYKSINISWSGVTGASGYEIYKATSSSGTYTLITKTTATKYNNTGLVTNGTYYYKVRSYRTVGTIRVYSNWTAVVYAKA